MEGEKDSEGLLEAVLFLSGRYLSMQELVMFTNVNPITLKDLLGKLQKKYENHSAFEVVCKNEKYKMDVKSNYAYLINKIATGQTEFSKAEQETLAIIAYKQPITQAVVVKIRGNKAYDHVKHLIEVGLIKTKRVSHTLELSLDDSFYNYFSVEKRQKEEVETEMQTVEMPGTAEINEAKAKSNIQELSPPENSEALKKQGFLGRQKSEGFFSAQLEQ